MPSSSMMAFSGSVESQEKTVDPSAGPCLLTRLPRNYSSHDTSMLLQPTTLNVLTKQIAKLTS